MKTVLVIDDSAAMREALVEVLHECGYRTVCAIHGAEALGLLDGVSPDLVLLDMRMPVMGGLATLEQLREDPRWASLPVIVMSAEIFNFEIDRVKRMGVERVYRKTESAPAELIALVEEVLGKAEGSSGA